MKLYSAIRRGALVVAVLAATLLIVTTCLRVEASSSSQLDNKQSKKVQERIEAAITKQLEQKPNQQQQQIAPQAIEQAAALVQAQVAEKKQGDASAAASASSQAVQEFFNGEEYVQIKPEEITINENGKEEYSGASQAQAASLGADSSAQAPAAEHKSSADDELNAHLASDSIAQQESAYRPAYAAAIARPRPASPQPYPSPSRGAYKPAPMRPIVPHPPAASSSSYQRGPRSPPRLPPSYITLKGKLTGINSLISQYPHPAPGYPHQGPRHLPRGAAAGYAAFRDFVRAHASKYKSPLAAPAPAPAPQPAYSPAQPAAPQYEAPKEVSGGDYKAPVEAGPAAYPEKGASYKASNGQTKTKVTVAQAYIPHPVKSAGYNSAATQSVLAKLYGNHAPQGVGKPEYSKDYGMVIHYPQATVYTEPMTVDQLHKLTGAGISQVLEQLQYNLAHGHRDESNIIRANNKHHIGHGITIHAKEYYAPSKSGQYVPTTAAVISTQGAGKYGAEEQGAAYDQVGESASSGNAIGPKGYELGSGYDRVKQAVAASQERGYSNKYSNNQPGASEYRAPAAPSAGAYGEPASADGGKYGSSNGEPLSAITSFLGAELESLYKANAALTKHIEPEIQQAIAKATSGGYGKSQSLKYHELGQASPFTPYNVPFAPSSGPKSHPPPQYAPKYPAPPAPQPYPRPQRYFANGPRGQKGPRRGPNRYPQRHPSMPNRYRNQPPSGYRQQSYGPPPPRYPQQPRPQPYQQSSAYRAVEQAMNQQMMQLLQDFQAGDEQYSGKNLPNPVNQGYPYKIMQKYNQMSKYGNQQNQQQQQGYQQQAPAPLYNQQDGLEIPSGPNDQLGEISDLIEVSKVKLTISRE